VRLAGKFQTRSFVLFGLDGVEAGFVWLVCDCCAVLGGSVSAWERASKASGWGSRDWRMVSRRWRTSMLIAAGMGAMGVGVARAGGDVEGELDLALHAEDGAEGGGGVEAVEGLVEDVGGLGGSG
jgi:hypothetical protein